MGNILCTAAGVAVTCINWCSADCVGRSFIVQLLVLQFCVYHGVQLLIVSLWNNHGVQLLVILV